ncbi:MAG: M61 family peptidase, partial [Alphaproteobacteria bacterium]|nr:M61 family peptidase [Alphaproteobacteria bacterium]
MNHTDYYILFAHEHLHNWIGGKISNNERSSLDYWWSEGFTDYYARVLALRSGGISLEEFIDECNQILRNYYLSPVINQPNSKIKNSFWKNENVQKLPYARGFVFAVYLNSLIKLYDDTKSVDNIILDLFKIAKQQPFSVKSFKEIAKNYTFQGIEQEISRFIDQGKTINLTATTNVNQDWSYQWYKDSLSQRLIDGKQLDSLVILFGENKNTLLVDASKLSKGYEYYHVQVTNLLNNCTLAD